MSSLLRLYCMIYASSWPSSIGQSLATLSRRFSCSVHAALMTDYSPYWYNIASTHRRVSASATAEADTRWDAQHSRTEPVSRSWQSSSRTPRDEFLFLLTECWMAGPGLSEPRTDLTYDWSSSRTVMVISFNTVFGRWRYSAFSL